MNYPLIADLVLADRTGPVERRILKISQVGNMAVLSDVSGFLSRADLVALTGWIEAFLRVTREDSAAK